MFKEAQNVTTTAAPPPPMPPQNTSLTPPPDSVVSSNKAGSLRKYVRVSFVAACLAVGGLALVTDYLLTREERRNNEENQERVQRDMKQRGLTKEEYLRLPALSQSARPSLQPLIVTSSILERPGGTYRISNDMYRPGNVANSTPGRQAEEERLQAANERYVAGPEYKTKELKALELEKARLQQELSKAQTAERAQELRDEADRITRRKAMDDGVADKAGRRYCAIPSGEFQIGSSIEADSPVRMMMVEGFVIGQTEVTEGEWSGTLTWANAHGYGMQSGEEGKDPSHPVVNVSWLEAVAWSNAKSEMEGLTPCYYLTEKFEKDSVYRIPKASFGPPKVHWNADGYRLPTEAEWEKAARGGLVDQFYPNGNTLKKEDANFSNEGGSTKPVMRYKSNLYGLFDMAGNVSEWCWDIHATGGGFSANMARGYRGGGWELNAEGCRVSFTAAASAEAKSNDRGFRLVRRPR